MRSAVLQQVGDALCRMGRIDRHVSTACLEYRQQANQGVQPSLGDHCHAPFRAYPETCEVLGQGACAVIELAVTQGLVAETGRQGSRLRAGLQLDALLNQAGRRVRR